MEAGCAPGSCCKPRGRAAGRPPQAGARAEPVSAAQSAAGPAARNRPPAATRKKQHRAGPEFPANGKRCSCLTAAGRPPQAGARALPVSAARSAAGPAARNRQAQKENAAWAFSAGGKDSVKENRQGCLSRSIRAGAAPLWKGKRSPGASKKDAPAHMPTFPYARGGMCEGWTICGSSLRVISGQWLPLYGIVCVPPAPAKKTPPPICQPSPTQGEGCVKGGPSAGPPFALYQGSGSLFMEKYAFPRRQQKRRHSASFLLARQKGFEPPAFPLGGGRSIRLSYWRVSDDIGGKSSHVPLILPAAAAFVNAKKFLWGTSHPAPKVL